MFLLGTWDGLDWTIEVIYPGRGFLSFFYSFLLASDSNRLELGDEAGLF